MIDSDNAKPASRVIPLGRAARPAKPASNTNFPQGQVAIIGAGPGDIAQRQLKPLTLIVVGEVVDFHSLLANAPTALEQATPQ